jgi:uncharacterized radical SAM superfamily Fe-S cluster-containing enzyme
MQQTTEQNSIYRTVPSLCPECRRPVSARIISQDGRVYMEKRCAEHGDFKELYWSSASLYEKFNRYWCDGRGIEGAGAAEKGCPFDCGLCSNHLTGTLLGNIDITSRCNLDCPVCFASAGGRLYEPSIEQIRFMMESLRSQRPVPCPAVQLSGGEPTLRDDLPRILAMAREMGFAQIQIATNGLRLAGSLDLCRSLERSGLNTVYLQFDGTTPEPYQAIRGRDLFPIKQKALQNFRSAGLASTVLVPTLARGVNDHQVGEIVAFASKNLDVVNGINFQPISFAGRIDAAERAEKRITIPDLLMLLEEQTEGQITRDDFYPVPFVVPISSLLAARSGHLQSAFTVHPCCGAATYVYSFNGRLIPINRFIDVEGLLERIRDEAENYDGSRLGRLKLKGKVLRDLSRYVDEARVPGELHLTRMLLGVFRNGTRESLTEFHKKTLFLGAMHFQDLYNIDLERLRRCGVHYATPDGRIIPFCAYNTLHRPSVEENFSAAPR